MSFREAAGFWIKLGFINFGGPAGQIALMHEELVERRRWITAGRFLHALNYCMLLPGPEAQQLAIYVGWLLHKVRGGLLAGIAFILPAFFLIWGLSWIYAAHADVEAVSGLFLGLQAAVVGIVAHAVIRIGKRALRTRAMVVTAGAAFVAIFVFHLTFPVIILAAGLIGAAGLLGTTPAPAEGDDADVALRDDAPMPPHTQPSARRAVTALVVGLAVWIVPLVLITSASWAPPVLSEQAAFFSKAALVTFGGAYAVLAYINVAAIVIRLAAAGPDGDGSRTGRIDPRPLDHGDGVRGVHGRLPAARDVVARAGGRARRARRDVGDVRAVLPVDLPRSALRRGAAREPAARIGAVRRDRRGGRRRAEPRRRARHPYVVRSGPGGRGARQR